MTKTLLTVFVLLSTALSNVALAQPPPAPTIEYYHLDAVGSVRAVTNESGQVVRRHHYFPFGEEYLAQGGNDPLRFTGKERDAETGLDYFGARYYAARLGRFTMVDPALDLSRALFEPQRWQRYQYAGNNPLRNIDPDGRDFYDKAAGFANALTSNMFLAPALRQTPTNPDYAKGQTFGDMASLLVGLVEIKGGVSGLSGSGVLVFSGVGTGPALVTGSVSAGVLAHGSVVTALSAVQLASNANPSGGNGNTDFSKRPPAEGARKLRGGQGWRDAHGNIWTKDKLHKDHWDVTDRHGKKIREVDFSGDQVWPDGPKHKNKGQ